MKLRRPMATKPTGVAESSTAIVHLAWALSLMVGNGRSQGQLRQQHIGGAGYATERNAGVLGALALVIVKGRRSARRGANAKPTEGASKRSCSVLSGDSPRGPRKS